MKKLDSPLSDIMLGPLEAGLPELIRSLSTSSIIIIADTNTASLCLPAIRQIGLDAPVITIPAGESHKNIDSCKQIWSELVKLDATRDTLVINLGGGMVCDIGGFAAACFQRGILFAHIPTTVLSMTDAAIGGKLGIDFDGLKNYIGLIRQPSFVWIDPVFIDTLPRIEKISGLAEIVKHAIISNPGLFAILENIVSVDEIQWVDLFKESIQVKLRIVEIDPNESGIRKTLNFGHTIGHALESYLLTSTHPLTHGQAITIGMLVEAKMANMTGMMSDKDTANVQNLIIRLLEPIRGTLPTFEALKSLIGKDKKKGISGVGYSLPTAIGSCQWDIIVEEQVVRESFHSITTQVLS